MNIATFYIVQPDTPQCHTAGFEDYILFLLRHFAKQGIRLYINCENKQTALHWDEKLWQQPPDQFLAHNLVGEGPRNGTMIEIGYSELRPSYNRQLVINLSNDKTNFAGTFAQMVDFVPYDEKAKQSARERYKIYRQAGYQMQTIAINHPD